MLKLPPALTDLQKKEIVSFLVSMQGGKVGHLSLNDCSKYGYDPHVSYYRLANSSEFYPITDAVSNFSDFFYSQVSVINDVSKMGEVYSRSIANPNDPASIKLRRGGVSSLLSYNEFNELLTNRLMSFDQGKGGLKSLTTLLNGVLSEGGFVTSYFPQDGKLVEPINKQWIESVLSLSELQLEARQALKNKSAGEVSKFVDNVWLSLSQVGAQPVLKKYYPLLSAIKDFPSLLNDFLKVPSNDVRLSSRITEAVLSAMSACAVGFPVSDDTAPLDAGYSRKTLANIISEQLSNDRNFSEWVAEHFSLDKIERLHNKYGTFANALYASVKRDEFILRRHLESFGYEVFHDSLSAYSLSENDRLYLKSQSLKVLFEHGSKGKDTVLKEWAELSDKSIKALSEIKQLNVSKRLEFLDKAILAAPDKLRDALVSCKNNKTGMISILSNPNKICLTDSSNEINLRFGLFYNDYHSAVSEYIKRELPLIQGKGQDNLVNAIVMGLDELSASRTVFGLKTKSGEFLPSNEVKLIKDLTTLLSGIEDIKNNISIERDVAAQVDLFPTQSLESSEIEPLSLPLQAEQPPSISEVNQQESFKEGLPSLSTLKDVPAWDMPQDEWASLQIKLSEYAEEYLSDQELYTGQFDMYKKRWVSAIKDRATSSRIRTDVLDSFVSAYGEKALFSEFRGVHEIGIKGYELPTYRLWDKTYSAVLKQSKTGELGATLDGQVRALHIHCIKKALEANEDVPENILKHYGIEKTNPHNNLVGQEPVSQESVNLENVAIDMPEQDAAQNAKVEKVTDASSLLESNHSELTPDVVEGLYDKFSDKFYKNGNVPTELEEAYDWFNLLWEQEIEKAPLPELQDRINAWFARLNVSPLKKDIVTWFEDTAELHQLISSFEEKHNLHFSNGELEHVPSERINKLIGEIFRPGTRIPLDDLSSDKARTLVQESDLLYKLNTVFSSPCVEQFKQAIGAEKGALGASFLLEYLAHNSAQKAIEKINEIVSSSEQMSTFLDRNLRNANRTWEGIDLFLGKPIDRVSRSYSPEQSCDIVAEDGVQQKPRR